MIRFILLLIVLAMLGVVYLWYSTQTLPDWYDKEKNQSVVTIEQLSRQIKQQGVDEFLRSKFADVMDGRVELSEVEFNALLLSGISNSKNGRRLLSVSEAMNATIRENDIEIGAVVNLNEASKINDKTKKVVAQLRKAMPLLDDSTIFLAVTGKPVAKAGNIGLADEFNVKIGAVPISSRSLVQLGIPVERVSTANLPLKYMSIQSIDLQQGKVILKVLPKFN